MANFLNNAWYVAFWISELDDKPLKKKILGRNVLFYRDSNGAAIGLSNECPHRFAPLHKGRIEGDTIECPYHGLRFDRTGLCVYNPYSDDCDGLPANAVLRAFPVVEKYRFIWVWMGDPQLANEAEIPDYSFLDNTAAFTATAEATLTMPVNYELILDNLMDLSHGQFLHATTLGNSAMAAGSTTARKVGNIVYSERLNPAGEVPLLFAPAQLVDAGALVDFWNDMWWAPGSCYYLEVGITPAGRPREEGVLIKSAQILTPVDERNTEYRHILYRDFLKENDAVTIAMEALVSKAFSEEDEPMLIEVQDGMAGKDFWELRPAILKGDRAAIMVRRTMQKLIEDELNSSLS
ncbi:MAG: aromatic ring-hydroxylating dioxygenase subunit alpha [Zhongshania sp.]|uniref:aromatic ring-hydroxylating dioxygenase subunit alpha n=1 Tax=Zhongshania sp. TaxID=1971902 RepID=UPI00260F11FD|nr:aromatic ring-hydroxylating dioxygenase subunit alpha [Zhongshania sp.]MDF1690850.1 aromatic ring-hydroxylating dioxygenase subunit alpha [Zhongshania sp.]